MVSRWILLRMRNVSDERCRQNQNTNFLFNSFPPPPQKSYCLWDNVEKYARARQATGDNIIWRMCFACWVTKAADTLSRCNIYCFSMATMVIQEHLSVPFIHTLPVFSSMVSTVAADWGHSHTQIMLLQSCLTYSVYIFSLQSTWMSWCCQQKHQKHRVGIFFVAKPY
jgi:hypothetical protein